MFICMFDESDVLDGLNEQQRRAVTHQGGPLLVLAGAGTGKTRTLVARAAWLRGAQGVPASRILLLTFTRRAASDMLARAAAGSGSSERICGGTFHAIAHKIIRQHAESFSLPPQFTILDPGDVADILDVLRPDHGLAEAGQRAPRAAACVDIYTRCVNTGRPVSEVVTASFPWCAPFTAQLAGLFRAYTARKRARHLLRDQAVLVRAAHHSDILEIELGARKIPYVKFGGLRFTDTAHVKDFLATARILANPADDLAWFRLLRLHEGIGPAHARLMTADQGLGWSSGWHARSRSSPCPPRVLLARPCRRRAGRTGAWRRAGRPRWPG